MAAPAIPGVPGREPEREILDLPDDLLGMAHLLVEVSVALLRLETQASVFGP